MLRYSIDKVTVELLYLPLSAAETFRVKAFIDTVIYRLGDGMGGARRAGLRGRLGWIRCRWAGSRWAWHRVADRRRGRRGRNT